MRKLITLVILHLFSLGLNAQSSANAAIITNDTLFCTGVPITYSVVTTASNPTYTWSVIPTKGLRSFTDLSRETVTFVFDGTVTYSVIITILDDSGIPISIATTVKPTRSANASFNASLNNTGFPTSLTLTNYSTNYIKSYWAFSDESSVDSTLNVVKSYSLSGDYTVSLFLLGEKGCNDREDYKFSIANTSDLILPTIFTPNGDGSNDVYSPITVGIEGLRAWIYNRNGVIVSTWDKPKGGWDGHSTSGEECSAGVYFIAVDAYGFDGKTYNLKGTITLIR